MVTRIALLGSTGSIGHQTLDVIDRHPGQFEIVTLAAGNKLDALRAQIRKYRPRLAVAKTALTTIEGVETLPSPEGLTAAATHPDVDLVVCATSGHAAIPATIAAIRHNKQIALANKEAIVCAGDLIIPLARQHGITIRPVDSEHSAIWQSLAGHPERLHRITLTASGGPFRNTPARELASVTWQQALRHPTWNMGAKLTIDSATLVNKGLELIEAHWLFDLPLDQITIVVHPESIVHSLVEFTDRSTIAQLSFPDMRLPIQYALTWPDRLISDTRPLDLVAIGALTFEAPDMARFPALRLAREAGEAGQTFPAVFSAVDEVAVHAFAGGALTFPGIPRLIETVMQRHDPRPVTSLDTVLAADAWARRTATTLLREIA